MKFNFKSRKGFTLIELLVVIGILAVLAAIAIPSVAGLIDRANVSADKTNANEMTNAVERFVSEYELYKQDVASGALDTSNLDSAQGRVFNVTGITSRENIEKFESTGLSGKGVDIDTKYPANEETVKAVIQNYTKTSSSTFEPKQSDCQYYYSPEVGAVIVGETGATVSELNNIWFSSEEDASAEGTIQWICLDETVDNVATDTKNTSGSLTTTVVKPVIKTMIITNKEYQFEEGMTWEEWLTSEYNVDGFRKAGLHIRDATNKNYLLFTIETNVLFEDGTYKRWGMAEVYPHQEIFDIEYIAWTIGVIGCADGDSYSELKYPYNGYYYIMNYNDGTVYRIPA